MEKKFVQLIAVERLSRTDARLIESCRLRVAVRIVNGIESRASRPKPDARAFVRIRLLDQRVRKAGNGRVYRSTLAGESRHRQIKSAPEKMSRTDFADVPRSK